MTLNLNGPNDTPNLTDALEKPLRPLHVRVPKFRSGSQKFSEIPKISEFLNLTREAKMTDFILRVVQTKTILFLKSMSEKVGSDIERL